MASKAQSQSEKFLEKARELSSDEDEAAFDQKLKKIAGEKSKAEEGKVRDK